MLRNLTEIKHKVWIFTFEYKGIAKVGGLGEVPSNQAKFLSEKFDVTVFIPSHGQLDNLKKKNNVEKLPFKCVGQLEPMSMGINRPESSYIIEYYKMREKNVDIILLKGENMFTSTFLDDKIVYNPDTFSLKICLYSIGIRGIIEYFIGENAEQLPHIVHLHDYHVVIPFIGMKQVLKKHDLDVRSIITIHLLTWQRFNLNFYKACGIDDTPIKIITKDGFKEKSITEIFIDTCLEEQESPLVEKIGAYISDIVTSVSMSYLSEEIIPHLGADLIAYKSDFVWNGCDWNYESLIKEINDNFGEEMRDILKLRNQSEISREDMKKYLLVHKLGNLKESPIINSKRILETIRHISQDNPYIKNGSIIPFDESGPLMITTGRISPQKGFETIFDAIPHVIKQVPNAKFLFLLNPTEYSLNEMEFYSKFIKKYPKNVRIIFGVAAEVYKFTHLVADIYAALSRWEPFGIMALEAMALKLPVIATKVGGLQESIIDIKSDPINGTGFLVDKDDCQEFAKYLTSFFILAEISKDHVKKEKDTKISIDRISDEVIKFLAINDNDYYNKIRNNCYNRVNNYFRWNIVTSKLVFLYNKVMELNHIN